MPGIYVKLDANYEHDPKIIEAGERAEILYVRCLCLAKRTLSDGFISDSQLGRFGLTRVQSRVNRLQSVGLLARDDERNGWWIVSWMKHNKSASEVNELSETRRLAGKMGGRPKQNASGKQKQSAKHTENPETKTETELETKERESSFASFWETYPRAKQTQQRGGGASRHAAEKIWRKLKPDERESCLVAAENYARAQAQPDSPFTAHATTWLNQRRWETWKEPPSTNGSAEFPSHLRVLNPQGEAK